MSQAAGAVVHVVEDDEFSRTASARVLRQAGHAVRLYASADEFLQHLPDGPGCIVLDLQMPGIGGFEVVESVGLSRMPAVIFVTAYDQFSLRAFDVHAVDYVLKPIDPARFATAIQRARLRLGSMDPLGERIAAILASRQPGEGAPALVVQPRARRPMSGLLKLRAPGCLVISINELPIAQPIEVIAVIGGENDMPQQAPALPDQTESLEFEREALAA